MNDKFALYTNSIISKLPYWFKMRKENTTSIGADFLDCVGLELDDVRFILDYAYNQVFIEYADLNQIDILYKAELPETMNIENIESCSHSEASLKIVTDLTEFYSLKEISLKNEWLYDKSYCFIDLGRKMLYVHQPYDKDNASEFGKITVKYNGDNYVFNLSLHHVWNFFDEFGMLLNCKRLFGESNYNYKQRLLDVFKNIGNASRTGLLNGIARELNLRKNIIWEDASKDLIIKDKMVVLNKIKIDNEFVPLDKIFINEVNQIIIKGNSDLKNVMKEVSFVNGIEMHEIFNAEDISFQNELYYSNGKPKQLLKHYAAKIRSISATFWGDFVWNETYWDMSNSEKGGLAYIPNFKDAKIDGFKLYK